MNRFEFSMKNGRPQCGIWVSSIPAQHFDKRYLYLAFAGHTARYNQTQGIVDGAVFRASFEENHCNIDNVRRQGVVPDRILCNEFQQAGVAEIVASLEENALVDEARASP
jgi:hypothetical protein